MNLLTDPALVFYEQSRLSVSDHWSRFASWTEDSRVRLGIDTFRVVSENFQTTVDSAPGHLQALVRELLGRLVSRGPVSSEFSHFTPNLESYLASGASLSLMTGDLSVNRSSSRFDIASDESLWIAGTGSVSYPNGDDAALLFAPHSPSEAELSFRRSQVAQGLRIVIVGGQVNQRMVRLILDELSLSDSSLQWLPSEKRKRPRGLDSVVSGLAGKKSIVICITGQIGHSTSISLKSDCRRRSVDHIEAESVANAMEALRCFLDTAKF